MLHRRFPVMGSRIAAAVLLACIAVPLRVGANNAIEIRSLSPEAAAKGLPVTLRGTVVFVEPTLVFLQDETAATYFRPDTLGTLQPGHVVEVRGRTEAGLYLPGVEQATYRILSRGTLPPPVDATYEDLLSGRFHYQRVAVEGIVRSVAAQSEGRSILRVSFSSRVLDVWVEAAPDKDLLLVDSHVRITGLAVGTINNRRQLVQPYLRALDWSAVEIVKPAMPEEEIPRIAPKDLMTFGGAAQGGNRVRLSGVVIASFSRGMLYLKQGKTAFGARLLVPIPVNLGDRVDVIGFPEMNRFNASLVDAELVGKKAGLQLAPVEVRMGDLYHDAYDGDLVTVTGVVTDSYRTDRERTLVLQDNEHRVRVSLLDPEIEVPVGSTARVTGISRTIVSEGVGYASLPEAISIYVRARNDFSLVKAPSWWTVRRLSVFLAVLVGAMLLAGLWIALLRRQVSRQAAAARQRIESEAALEERQRLAREFHDTLEQELVGLGLRLDAVATRNLDEKGRTLVEASRSLVARIQSETRNLVSDLRSPAGNAVDLRSALSGMSELKSPDGRTEVRIEVSSAVPPLPVGAVHNLRMVARESVTNALKHSGATQIVVRVEIVDDSNLVMTITDNGRGFDVAIETVGKRGHFGCVGIRERCGKLGAHVVWRSAPGQGATVTVTLSLAHAEEEVAISAATSGKVHA